uniref:Phosphatidylinositol transfer protein beta isoform n=1 Tax=Gouania willdenowi TaxID=441366 RepID=A0A8C5HXT4_GOUWI
HQNYLEYKIICPLFGQIGNIQYQVGQLFSVAEASKNETGGGEGIEVLKNEPYVKADEKGQYTHKIYHLKSKVPKFVRAIAPEGSLVFHEKAWNAYPYFHSFMFPCNSLLQNEYMKDNFEIKIETWHKPDLGTTENVHKLDAETWKYVAVVPIDIADRSQVSSSDYKEHEDPAKFKSVKTGRGPLGPTWKNEVKTLHIPQCNVLKMSTCHLYSLCVLQQEKRIFNNFHRQLFCWIDKWVELSMEDIRRMESETQRELEEVSAF